MDLLESLKIELESLIKDNRKRDGFKKFLFIFKLENDINPSGSILYQVK